MANDGRAAANLWQHQRQLDDDGVMVGVSRQAVCEVLAELAETRIARDEALDLFEKEAKELANQFARAERAETRIAELLRANTEVIAACGDQCVRAERAEAECKAMREASEGIGFWLSAALDDRGVCDAMKTDIRAWFAALNPSPADPG